MQDDLDDDELEFRLGHAMLTRWRTRSSSTECNHNWPSHMDYTFFDIVEDFQKEHNEIPSSD